MSRMWEVAAIAIGGYVLIVAGLALLQREFLYFPDRTPPDPALYDAADVAVVTYPTPDGLSRAGWYFAAPHPDAPVIVMFHGNAGNLGIRANRMAPLRDAGYGVLLAGYRGYGGEPGRPTEHGLLADASGALSWLSNQGIPVERTILYGESLGTGVAVAMAAEHRVGAVVLEAPYTSILAVAESRLPFIPVRVLLQDRFDSLARIDRVTAPLLVMHGRRDQVIPFRFGAALFEAANPPKRSFFVDAADHFDLNQRGGYGAILGFLAAHGLSPAG